MKRNNGDCAPFDRCMEHKEKTNDTNCLLVLQSLHLNEFASLFHVLEQFYDGFELCDHHVNFSDSSNILEKASAAFSTIDKDDDGAISLLELRNHGRQHPESLDEVEWLECHYLALANASLTNHEAIRRQDLDVARRVFHGLDFVQQHFRHLTAGGASKIHPEDLLRLVCCRESLTVDEALGVWHLIHYLLHLRKNHSLISEGLTREQLEDISPEKLWLRAQAKVG